MNLQEGIAKLKELLNFSEEKEKEVYKFETAKLNDGVTIVEWEGDLLTGAIVMIVGEAGKLPAPIGVYTLEDGTTFEVVNETGAIDNVVKVGDAPKENAAPEVAPEMAEATAAPAAQSQAPSAPKRVIKSQVEEHVFKIELDNEILELDFSSVVNSINEKFEKENKELKDKLVASDKLNKEVFKVVAQIADEPLSTPTEETKTSRQTFNALESKKAFKANIASITKKLQENI